MIERFLPRQMSDDEAKAAIAAIIAETGASAMKDMGRVMALVKERLGSVDRAGAGQRPGQGRALLTHIDKKGPAANGGGAQN